MGALDLDPYGPNGNLVDWKKFQKSPSKIMAQLLRKQYEDYIARYQGTENALMDMTSYNNPELVSEEVATATNTANNAMAAAAANQQYAYQHLGMAQTAETQQANTARNSLNTSTAVVDAANKVRQRIADRNQQIALGSTPNAGRAYGLALAPLDS